MLRLAPILIAVIFAYVSYRFSVWRTLKDLDARSSPLADARLLDLCAQMARAQGIAKLPVSIYEVSPINGLAAPDGRIFLTRGFYERYRNGAVSAEEMASVIAHELGHVALGHGRRRMVDFSGQNAMRMALGMILSRLLPGVGMWIANAITGLLAAKLSREDEYEADAYAAALLTKSGIGTKPQKSLFAKLDHLTGAGTPVAAWLMSHPETRARIKAIEALEARWGQLG